MHDRKHDGEAIGEPHRDQAVLTHQHFADRGPGQNRSQERHQAIAKNRPLKESDRDLGAENADELICGEEDEGQQRNPEERVRGPRR